MCPLMLQAPKPSQSLLNWSREIGKALVNRMYIISLPGNATWDVDVTPPRAIRRVAVHALGTQIMWDSGMALRATQPSTQSVTKCRKAEVRPMMNVASLMHRSRMEFRCLCRRSRGKPTVRHRLLHCPRRANIRGTEFLRTH